MNDIPWREPINDERAALALDDLLDADDLATLDAQDLDELVTLDADKTTSRETPQMVSPTIPERRHA